MEEKEWPEYEELMKNIEEGVKEYTCDFTKNRCSTDKGAWYIGFSKLAETIDEFNLCEESYLQANSNDINPIIYYRVGSGLKVKDLEKLMTFELQKYYKTQSQYGIRFTLSPDFQFTIN